MSLCRCGRPRGRTHDVTDACLSDEDRAYVAEVERLLRQWEAAPLSDGECEALLDVLALDVLEDARPAFAFRPGWWTWEHPGALDCDLTLEWARAKVARQQDTS